MAAAPRIWLVGFGTVGQWLAEALLARPGLAEVVGIATARDGFVHDPAGIDLSAALDLRRAGRPLTELSRTKHHETALAGLRATEADALVEVGLSPAADGQPGLDHMREALGRPVSVVTSNKWPVALAGVELVALARDRGVAFRAESTVMSGTPVIGPLTEGLAGARPRAVRGVLNATTNSILTQMGEGMTYATALARAQERGLAEPDPGADVDGYDTVSKLMVLSALVFGRPLALADVERRGISALDDAEVAAAGADGLVVREVAELDPDADVARVAPRGLPPTDSLARVSGVQNAIECEADPLGRIVIEGPGAGPQLAGQGVLSDLLRVTRALRRDQAL